MWFADVAVVGRDRLAVVQADRAAVEILQHWGAGLVVGTVATEAAILEERLASFERQRPFGMAIKPFLVVGRLHDVDGADHAGVVGAAVLGTEQVIVPRRRRLEPHGGITIRQHVHVNAEVGHEKAVDHVLRREQHLDGPPGRDVQLVDLALPFRVLELPHPLLALAVDHGGIVRRRGRR